MGGWNGSGSVTLDYDWSDDRDAEIPIDADRMDAQQEDLRAAIEACLAKNGENAATGNLDLNGNALILDADADTKIDVTTDDRIDFNAGGSDIVRFDGTTASVMNFFDLVAKATGTKPVLKARGEANIGLAFEDSNGNEIFQFDTVASAVNYLVAASSATGNALTLTATGDDTNISINLVPKGSGRLQIGAANVPTVSSTDTLTNKTIDLTDNTVTGTAAELTAVVSDDDPLFAGTADVLTAGFATTTYNAGTKSSGTYTPDEANGNFQRAVNGGAHTLAPPSNDCNIVVQYTNDGSAGAITTSGFTQVTGDSFDTTNGNDFLAYITKINGFSHLNVVALQ